MSIPELQKKIAADVRYCMTPDLPYLRYQGPTFKVFLYDDMQDINSAYYVLQMSACDTIRMDSQVAVTVEEFSPYHNTKFNYEAYDAYMFDNEADLSITDIEKMKSGTVMGKLVEVSLGTLCKYDFYYDQGHAFNRKKIEVLRSPKSTQVETVFAYVANPRTNFTIANGNDEKYNVVPSIQLSPYLLEEKEMFYKR